MKKSFFAMILIIVSFAGSIHSQVFDNYSIDFQSEGSVNKVFIEMSNDSTFSRFVEDADYQELNIADLFAFDIAAQTFDYTFPNNGMFVRIAIVAEDQSGFYSPLASSYAYRLPKVPFKPFNIRINKKQ